MATTAAFDQFNLRPELLRAVTDEGYTIPTPIQAKAIPIVLEGRDVLAAAQTGTGKTAAFVLPILTRLVNSGQPRAARDRQTRTLILAPTRELAAQIHQAVKDYGRHLKLRSACIFGGVGMQPQIDAMKRGVDVLVATPGRLLDHVGEKTVDLRAVEILVLDEADRMLDMGFINDIRKVLAILPRERQNLLFSATFSAEIKSLAGGFLKNPVTVEVARANSATELVSQVVHHVESARKRELLAHLIETGEWDQVLVFTRTKHGANRLAEQLDKGGITAAAIHGNKSQGARTRALADFKANKVRVLVATDIAARGIDIEELPHVVNFDLPHVAEDYIHRIGRTGRAGSNGIAVSLVAPEDRENLVGIERLVRQQIPIVNIDGFSIAPNSKFTPVAKPPQRGGRPGGSQGQRRGAGGGGGGQRGARSGAAQGAPRARSR